MELYRFRPFDIIKGQKTVIEELRESEMFLGTLEENNDPMDGVQNFFFQADKIAWMGLLKHFIFCSYDTFCILMLLENEDPENLEFPRTQICPARLQSEKLNQHLEMIQNSIFGNRQVIELLGHLESIGRVPSQVVSLVLRIIFPLVTQAINESNEALRSSLRIPFPETLLAPEILTGFNEELKNTDFAKLSGMAIAFDSLSDQRMLKSISAIRHSEPLNLTPAHKRHLEYLLKFPSNYLQSILSDTAPRYWISALSSNPKSISMWGHYAQGHRGICLVFTTSRERGKRSFALGYQRYPIQKVTYKTKVSEHNYFECLWHFGFKDLDEFFFHHNGEFSPLLQGYLNNSHQRHVDRILEKSSTKLKAWSHESEYRLVKYAFSREVVPKEDRIERYDPMLLTGIIFGTRTPIDCKVEVVKIIEERRRSHSLNPGFRFYQAQYLGDSRQLELLPLNLLGSET